MPAKLVVVEDSPTQALRLKLVLEREGVNVSLAQTGREGITMATLLLPAAVILDINLPDISGFEVCQAIKEHPATADIPVIMLTVKDAAIDAISGLDAGADAYIPKDDFAETNLRETLHDLGILEK